jgi:kumamolisin
MFSQILGGVSAEGILSVFGTPNSSHIIFFLKRINILVLTKDYINECKKPDFKRYARIFSEADQKSLLTKKAVNFTPMDLAAIYNVPTNYTGAGQKIAFIELGGGYRQTDLDRFFTSFWMVISSNSTIRFRLRATNNPTVANSDDMEVMLDLAVAIGVAKELRQLFIWHANSTNGFIAAINKAVADRVNIISISWGAPESYWLNTDLTRMNNAIQAAASANISVFVASGDSGASDGIRGLNVDYPGSCPSATSCGGTTLRAKWHKLFVGNNLE